MSDRGQPENPAPDSKQAGDMGKASLEESQDAQKHAPPAHQGPSKVAIPGKAGAGEDVAGSRVDEDAPGKA